MAPQPRLRAAQIHWGCFLPTPNPVFTQEVASTIPQGWRALPSTGREIPNVASLSRGCQGPLSHIRIQRLRKAARWPWGHVARRDPGWAGRLITDYQADGTLGLDTGLAPPSSDCQGILSPQRDKPPQTTLGPEAVLPEPGGQLWVTRLLPCPPGAWRWEEGENAGAGGLSTP